MSTEAEIQEPIDTGAPEGGGNPAVQGGGEPVSNPFFETFKTKYGVEVSDEDALHATLSDWKTNAEIAAARQKEVDEWKQKYEQKAVDYKTPFTRDVDAYAAKLIADKTPLEEISSKIEAFFTESRTNYFSMANQDPVAVLKKYYETSGDDYTEAQIARMVAKEAVLLDKTKYGDHLTEDEIDQMYQDNLVDLQIKAKGFAKILEDKKPKVGDFHPVGMMTKEQLEARVKEQEAAYEDSFVKYRDSFKGLQVGDTLLEMSLFDDKGKPTPEFAPVFEKLSKSVLAYVDEFFLEDRETPNAGRVAQMMLLESALPALLAKEREKAKSDALKEFEARLKGNGDGFGGNGGARSGEINLTDKDYIDSIWGKR